MRAYLPVGWAELEQLARSGGLPGPLVGWCVDPAWRSAAPDVTEEEWEYEAQELAAQDLGPTGGAVLAVEVGDPAATRTDGRLQVSGAIRRTDVQAVFSRDLSWFGVQEIDDLLRMRPA